MTLDFQGGEGLVDNLAGSQGGGLPRWHNLKHKHWVESRNQEIQKSRNLEIWKVLQLEDASLLLSPTGILPDAEMAPVVLRRLWRELKLRLETGLAEFFMALPLFVFTAVEKPLETHSSRISFHLGE